MYVALILLRTLTYRYIYIALTFESKVRTKLIRTLHIIISKGTYVISYIYGIIYMDIHAFRINKGRGHGRVQVIIKHCYYLILDGVLALFHI